MNASTTSSLAAGYETANDDSLTSGSGSMYFSMTDGGGDATKTAEEDEGAVPEDEPTLSGTLASAGHSSGVVDQTLENDFSVEEVSTIRKATIAHASPATVQVAAGMAVKYLGVSSTPAAPKTPKQVPSTKQDLSGFDQLEQTPSIMKKMRDPKTPAESPYVEDPEESKVTLDGSGMQEPPPPGNKSYGTNVLANFFASLDVNSKTPVQPEIKVSAPEEVQPAATSTGITPTTNKRESNSLENFFESLKKNPAIGPSASSTRRKSLVRKSLIPKVAPIVANRVASPISRRSTAVRLIPDKLREMRKTTNQAADQLVQFRRKSVAVPTASATTTTTKKSEEVPVRKSMAVAAVKAASTANSATLKRKSVVPATANGRRSVLPAVPAVRRGVISATAAPRVALKIPAKTTLSNGPDSTSASNSASTRRTLLGKRPATAATDKVMTPPAAEQPAAKQRKSLAPVKEASPAIRVSPRNKPATAPQSRIRPPTVAAAFKKPETFTCDHCQRIFRLRSSYETHLKTVHQNPATQPSPSKSSSETGPSSAGAKCQYCGKAFAGARFLTNHVVSNCSKVPLPEKRRLLAEGERERAANLKRTPDGAKKRMSLRPPTTTASNRSASSTRSGDETDTSTSSSSGATTSGSGGRKKVAVSTSGGGISRTPNKELKCHLCARRFLNAVEYALHVQAHAKNGKSAVGGGGDGENVENLAKEDQPEQEITSAAVSKLVQKLATLTKTSNGAKVGAVLKSSNSNIGNGNKK